MKKIRIISIKKLRVHERINRQNLRKIKQTLIAAGQFTKPIVVDDKYFVILDGHHRTQALKDFGLNKIPAYLVDYYNKKIKLTTRRKKIKVSKQDIINRALNRKPYPCKTSKHDIPGQPIKLNIKLCKLI